MGQEAGAAEGSRKPSLQADAAGRSNEGLILCLFGFGSFFWCVTKHLQFVLVRPWVRGREVSPSQTADGNSFQEYNSITEGIVE